MIGKIGQFFTSIMKYARFLYMLTKKSILVNNQQIAILVKVSG